MIRNRDYRDVLGGLLLTAVGGAAALYALSNYATGTFFRMGPGMVPVGLGLLLALSGVGIAVTGWRSVGAAPSFRLVAPLFVLGSILTFYLMIEPFGLIPTVFVVTIVAGLAEGEFRLVRAVASGLVLGALSYAVFIAGLRLAIPPFAWPL